MLELEVYSDVVCPWCYLGHRRLDTAIGRIDGGASQVRLRWRAFQLDPRAGRDPADLRAAIEAKYGPGAFEAMGRRLVGLGAEVGIDYRFEQALRVGTLDAHRLIQWAQAGDPSTGADIRADTVGTLVDALFRAYFTDGANIADPTTLVSIASQVGLDAATAAEVLTSGAWSDEVRADRADAVEAGVTGVPAVLYNGATVIPGAQDTDTMELIIRRLLTRVGN